ncbi:MAG: hypothetical protein AAGA75_15610 [Cyanobacteria bacterium P01_E01_bin.6]
MIHDNESSNLSKNRPFEDVLEARMSRRGILARGAALSATGFFAAIASNQVLARGARAATAQGASNGTSVGVGDTLIAQVFEQPGGVVNFEAIPISEGSGPDANISPGCSNTRAISVSPTPTDVPLLAP